MLNIWKTNYILRCSSIKPKDVLRLCSTKVNPKLEITPITKVLIANRGEIACRIIKTAKRLGVQTVAVFSDADAKSMHVQMADEAYNIGPAPSQLSYLGGENILSVAQLSGCQAIHPGYGFLSENLEFAQLCQNTGMIFIGPPASAIRDMGIKSTSKHIMSAAGVPIIEGYHGENQSNEKLIAEAERIGFPLMIKAVRGGGGKGMRIASSSSDFISALDSARTESQKSFGDSTVLLEQYVQEPRHVEVQVFADQHGNVVHLFERDCSVQRRHQKVIEEAPAPGLSEGLRNELGAAAVRAAKAVSYVGAGTVEFILDKHSHAFHFMEMNTRLQVEHPITEFITGTDLVEWQLRIASGEVLPLSQSEILMNGHAFEARIYAEDPRGGFLPGAGPLRHLTTPEPSPHVRVETGVRQGDEVSVHYDPMIAKLVVWGKNRQQALSSLQAQLANYHITGLETNVNFLLDLARHPSFVSGDVHTGFIEQHYDSLFLPLKLNEATVIKAALGILLNEQESAFINAARSYETSNPFVLEAGMRVNYDLERTISMQYDNQEISVEVRQLSPDNFQCRVGTDGAWRSASCARDAQDILSVTLDGNCFKCCVVLDHGTVAVFDKNGKTEFVLRAPTFLSSALDGVDSGAVGAVAPMPGILERLLVAAGDEVKKGAPLAVIIAMKMEYVIKASADGIVASVSSRLGQSVPKGAAIVTFTETKQ